MPLCGKTTEVYSRVCGYYRPLENWNRGKREEHKNKRTYDLQPTNNPSVKIKMLNLDMQGQPIKNEGNVIVGQTYLDVVKNINKCLLLPFPSVMCFMRDFLDDLYDFDIQLSIDLNIAAQEFFEHLEKKGKIEIMVRP